MIDSRDPAMTPLEKQQVQQTLQTADVQYNARQYAHAAKIYTTALGLGISVKHCLQRLGQ